MREISEKCDSLCFVDNSVAGGNQPVVAKPELLDTAIGRRICVAVDKTTQVRFIGIHTLVRTHHTDK